MSKLVIVESPAKAKTIKKYLGEDYNVIASMGHIRDLPKAQMGVDIEDNFKPRYINIPGKSKLIRELKKRSFKHIAMLTGDSLAAANAAAAQCEIDCVHAELLPKDKVEIMEQMAADKGGVLFVGDGINDAPVIAAATVGIAMGLGTDAAIETADIVLTSGNPIALLNAIDISRRTMGIVKFNIALSIIVKLSVIISAFFVPIMWLAVVADVILSLLCSLNSARLMTVGKFSQAIHRL
mgnify:CR=1 FL=1